MEKKKAILDWQVEFERPFKGLLKVLGNSIYDQRIYKLYFSGKYVAEIDPTVKFTTKIEKGESGELRPFMVNKKLEGIIKNAVFELKEAFWVFLFDNIPGEFVVPRVNQKIKGMKMEGFVVNLVSADLKKMWDSRQNFDKFEILVDNRVERKREYGFDWFEEMYEKEPKKPPYNDFNDELNK